MMASSRQSASYMEELNCPICLGLFNEPVTVECGHNFCRFCISKVWNSTEKLLCPECRVEFSDKKCIKNRLLANLVETAVKVKQGQGNERTDSGYGEDAENQGVKRCKATHHCKEHGKTLELFCEEDDVLVCALCVPIHYGHHFISGHDAVGKCQSKLKTVSASLESHLKELQEQQKKQEQKISSIKENIQDLEQHIRSEFVKLHQFLWDKEQDLILQLKEESSGILREMEQNLWEIEMKTRFIQEQMSSIQSKMEQEEAVLFLMDIKMFTQRLTKDQQENDNRSIVSQDLSLGVYKGPLQYYTWKQMKSFLRPGLSNLSLDTKTAHPELVLSEDLVSVRHCNKWQQHADNPERFKCSFSVLGSEGFTSGRHYWEVGVENKTRWIVGVVSESINRKRSIRPSPDNGYWVLCLRNGNDYYVCNVSPKSLGLNVKLLRIGMYLDYDGRQLSFYNADNMSHLYTFTHTFIERLYPYFNPQSSVGKNAECLKLFHLKL
ncbi:zinc-binding protein A33-like isoform X2 [Protopterus annectens]|uniref:zinc-binding protein A33-like isoform X2 n=1 Tax=Protopterus annectens TaxID=7888 RepID=UPI001CF9819D|nr:zinc-binding protein A33-like isoform X2 [Protopterus annectens]